MSPAELEPEKSVNYTAGVVFDTGPFTLTADYFRIDYSGWYDYVLRTESVSDS